jgi:hypothetical protein
LELCASIQVQCWLTVLCSETRPNAKPETVTCKQKQTALQTWRYCIVFFSDRIKFVFLQKKDSGIKIWLKRIYQKD